MTKHVPVLDGSLLGWLAATDDLALIPASRVLPGHGPAIEDWPGALADQRRYLERLTQDTRGLISRGAPLAVAARTAGLAEKDRWDLFEVIMPEMPRRHSPSLNGNSAALHRRYDM